MTRRWIRVSRRNKCPICGKPDWCMLSPDGLMALCARVASERTAGEGGWLHHVSCGTPAAPTLERERITPSIDANGLAFHYRHCIKKHQVEWLAGRLGVSAMSLDRLLVGWDEARHAYTFPMRDAANRIVGIRLRDRDTGKKWAVAGSKNGLFMPAPMRHTHDVVIVEGPTDCAAADTIGLDAIGRPDCRSCHGQLKEAIERYARYGARRIIVVPDNDAPGIDGAKKLVAELPGAKLVVPPCKDFRQWVINGLTGNELLQRALGSRQHAVNTTRKLEGKMRKASDVYVGVAPTADALAEVKPNPGNVLPLTTRCRPVSASTSAAAT